jgi:hypothetical protein
MKRISFNPRFVNEAGNDLIGGKIHTIRQNYDYWKKFEGEELALFTWEGKPYRSKQKVFCIKRLVSVQIIFYCKPERIGGFYFLFEGQQAYINTVNKNRKLLAVNDGFENPDDFFDWFRKGYKEGAMAVLHFTDFRY